MSKLFVYHDEDISSIVLTKNLLDFIDDYEVDVVYHLKYSDVLDNWCQRWMIKSQICDQLSVNQADAIVIFWNQISSKGLEIWKTARKLYKPYVIFMCNSMGRVLEIQ